MSTLLASNRTKAETIGSDKIEKGDQGGKVKHIFDSYTLQGAVLAVDDVIELFKLPANARVIEATINAPSLGTTGKISLGWKVSDDGSIVADPNGFLDAADFGGAAATVKMTATANMAGYLKKFDKPVLIQAVCTEISTATDVKISFSIEYVLD